MLPMWLVVYLFCLVVTAPFVILMWWSVRSAERAKRARREQWAQMQAARTDGGEE